MSQKFETHAFHNVQSLTSYKSVLIASGPGDDALYYQTHLIPEAGIDSFIAYFHYGSRFLERVRLFGSMSVRCLAPDGIEIAARLAFPSFHVANCQDGCITLSLTLMGYGDKCGLLERPLVPIT